MLIPSSTKLFLALNDLIILSISSGSVGDKNIESRFGTVFIECWGSLFDFGMASSYCLPIFVKYSQNLSAICAVHISLFLSIKKVSATLLLSLVHCTSHNGTEHFPLFM